MTTPIGSFNERGYLNGFTRRGFTPEKCLLELTANSLDSLDERRSTGWRGEPTVRFSILSTGSIRMRDNGLGMNLENARDMFDLYKENHAIHASRGVSGLGAKPALSILSGQQNMYILTHKSSGPFLRVDIPWEVIHRDGVFSNMITVREMTLEEGAAFGPEVGTEICFPYSDSLRLLLRQTFEPVTEDAVLLAPLDRIGIVFGCDHAQFILEDFEKGVHVLPMYNYFGAQDAAFYTGVTRYTIQHWISRATPDDIATHRFICNDEEIISAGANRLYKEPRPVQRNMVGYDRVGEYEVVLGLRRDNSIFNINAPVLPSAESKVHRNEYNLKHLGSDMTEEFLAMNKLRRNDQLIGYIPIADIKIGNSRANGMAYLEIQLLQCEVRYYPKSEQNNLQDKVMAIQENKNRHDGTNLPLTFTRLVKALRKDKANKIWEMFEELCVVPVAETVAPVIAQNWWLRPPQIVHSSNAPPTAELPVLTIGGMPVASAAEAEAQAQVQDEAEAEAEAQDEAEAEVQVEAEAEAEVEVEVESPSSPPNGAALLAKLWQVISPSKNYSAEIVADIDSLIAKVAATAPTD